MLVFPAACCGGAATRALGLLLFMIMPATASQPATFARTHTVGMWHVLCLSETGYEMLPAVAHLCFFLLLPATAAAAVSCSHTVDPPIDRFETYI
jgi:hypothetical protein